MKEERDQELGRLLGEYRDDLRRQGPSGDILARLQQEARLTSQPRKVLAFPSRRAMGGLAIAASLLVMVAVFRSRPGAASSAPVASEVAAPVASAPSVSAQPTAAETEPATQAKQTAKPKEIPSPRPEGLPSMQAVNEPSAPSPAPQASATAAPAVLADAEAKAESEESGKRADVARGQTPAPTLVAVIVQEVWPPGQLARVTSGSYLRLPDGREVRSVLTPVEAPAFAQNSQSSQVLQTPTQQPSSQQMQSFGQARRSPPPLRDQMQEARARIAAPQLTPLGEMVIEGYRCTGTRTLDGERTVERWRSAELGLDLLVRITDAQGGQTVTRYTRIERH